MEKHKRFKSRIELERKILTAVNKQVINSPLSGLTHDSIENWAKEYLPTDNLSIKVITQLKKVSSLSQLHNDCSRDTFSEDEIKIKNDINNQYNKLLEQLTNINITNIWNGI